MLAADPQIAGLADRISRRLGGIIGIAAHVVLDHKQPVEFVLIKPGQRQIESGGLQIAEFKPQQFLAPVTRIRQSIVCDRISLALRLAPTAGDDGRHLLDAFELCRLEPAVAGDQHAVLADQHRHGPAELAQRRPDLFDLLGAVNARIARVGREPLDRPDFDFGGRPGNRGFFDGSR